MNFLKSAIVYFIPLLVIYEYNDPDNNGSLVN